MRILEVADKLGFGGIERVVDTLTVGLQQRGHTVIPLSLLKCSPERGSLSLEIPQMGGLHVALACWRGIWGACRKYAIDVVHSHCWQATRAIGLIPANRPPLVATIHGSCGPYHETCSRRRLSQLKWEAQLFLRDAHVVYVSESVAEDQQAFWGSVGRRRAVIYNGVPMCLGQQASPRDIDVLQVGNVFPIKNQRETVSALTVLKNRGFRAVAVFIGDGDTRADVEITVRSCSLDPSVQFLGQVEARPFYRRAKVVVVPSFHESFSLSVVEAWQAGCIIIASDIKAHRELASKLSGLTLYPVGCPSVLADEIEHALNSFDAGAKENLRQLPKEFRAETMADSYEAILREALQMSRSRAALI